MKITIFKCKNEPAVNQCGTSMTEYGLLLLLLVIVSIAALRTVGENVSDMFSSVDSVMEDLQDE